MKKNFLSILKPAMMAVLVLFSFLQIAFFFEFVNSIAILITLAGWIITDRYLLTELNFQYFSLSSMIILGFSTTQFFFPLIFTFLELKPLTYNLKYPLDVFLHSILTLIVLVIVHNYYVNNALSTKFHAKHYLQRYLAWFGLFIPPTNRQLWVMGGLGMAAALIPTLFGYVSVYSGGAETDSTFIKFIQGFLPFAIAPFFIPLRNFFDSKGKKAERWFILKISAYTFFQIIFGIVYNSRGLMVSSFTAMGICFLLALLLNKIDYKVIKLKYVITIAIISIIISGPLNDISMAMLVVRSDRKDLSSQELVEKTLKAFNDKEAIKQYRSVVTDALDKNFWNEDYLNNLFLSRFCNLKFNDLSIEQYKKIGGIDEDLQDYTIYRLYVILPTPILEFFGFKIDKKKYTLTSFGDYIYFKAGGDNALGGLRTGHFAGMGMATFGWFYLVVLGVSMYPLYFAFDLFCMQQVSNGTFQTQAYICLLGLISILLIFFFLASSTSSESVTNIFGFLLRGWLQLVILYLATLKISKMF